jgi:hypothetical protein
MATPAKSRRRVKPARTFTCLFRFGEDTYAVFPLRGVHPEVAARAYRFKKQTGSQEVYDVRLSTQGYVECDCPGHTRHGHCKHVGMLAAMGCVPRAPEQLRPDGTPATSSVEAEFA